MSDFVDCLADRLTHLLVGLGQLARKVAFKQLEEKEQDAAQAETETEDDWRYVYRCMKITIRVDGVYSTASKP